MTDREGTSKTHEPTRKQARSGIYDGANRWWLNRARGRVVSLRLHSGDEVLGKLVNHDTYVLIVETPNEKHPVMVSKSAIATYYADTLTSEEEYIARRDKRPKAGDVR